MIRLLLGFDILAVPEVATWDTRGAKELDLFLLRPEIKSPISVDRLICPSIFQPEVQRSERMELVLTRFSRSLEANRTTTHRPIDWPESELNILGLWSDMSKMLLWLKQRPDLNELIRVAIAIRIFLDGTTISDPLWQTISEGGSDPAELAQGWPSLGYDVADNGQISALSDCGYQEDEMKRARASWGSDVNEWGLLSSVQNAVALKDFSNSRVPEHAPFYVYEIFRIGFEDRRNGS